MSSKTLQNSIEFMLYTNFGIDFEDGKTDKILDVAIDKAYNDATMQGAYNALNKSGETPDLSSIKNEMHKRIKKLLSPNPYFNDYSDWHKKICSYLTGAYENVKLDKTDDHAFTYGNAQKWVNMTMKYLYILAEIFHEYVDKYAHECDFDQHFNRIQELYKDLHVPVDSYIIEAVWDDSKQREGIPYKTDKLTKKTDDDGNRIPGAYSSDKYISWSNWENGKDDRQYEKFQDLINKNEENPLDWEHREWIRIAKKRKNQ